MHIVLGLLGSIVTILILVNRLSNSGFDIRDLNPFLWKRRRDWRKQYHANPLFSVQVPMEAAAVLAVGIARCDGDLVAEEKLALQQNFRDEFNLSDKDAAGMLTFATHLTQNVELLVDQIDDFLRPSRDKFSPEQAELTLSLMERIADVGGRHAVQIEFLDACQKRLRRESAGDGAWSA